MTQDFTLWNNCLDIIKDNINESSFSTWFEPIKPISYENDILLLQVPSQYFVEHIEDLYIDLLRSTLTRVFGDTTKLEYQVLIDQKTGKGPKIPSASQQAVYPNNGRSQKRSIVSPYQRIQLPELDPQLNFNLTFDRLIEGKSNQLARTAAIKIAEDPKTLTFNPLFVFGKSGVGKTHLLNSIGVLSKQLRPESRVLYVSANTFQIQYTDAVRNNTQNDFLNFYQTIDLLLIDDIQEFSGKTGTQNTFFHIFNHLHQNGKQLVLSSDRSPLEMIGVEQRLLTRFKWGLSAEISKPDFEMRKSILKNKIYNDGLDIPEHVVDYIAEKVTNNVRDLEGVLASLLAHSTLINEDIDLKLAESIISRITNIEPKSLTVEQIRDTVCEYFNLSIEAISTRSRKLEVVQARQIAMYFSKNMTQSSLANIGMHIGKRDHATVLHACKKVEDLIETDRHFRKNMEEIELKLKDK